MESREKGGRRCPVRCYSVTGEQGACFNVGGRPPTIFPPEMRMWARSCFHGCITSRSWMPRGHAIALSRRAGRHLFFLSFQRRRRASVRWSFSPPPFHLRTIHLVAMVASSLRIAWASLRCFPPPESVECYHLPQRHPQHRHELPCRGQPFVAHDFPIHLVFWLRLDALMLIGSSFSPFIDTRH